MTQTSAMTRSAEKFTWIMKQGSLMPVTPNVTIKERLQVFLPWKLTNYYEKV